MTRSVITASLNAPVTPESFPADLRDRGPSSLPVSPVDAETSAIASVIADSGDDTVLGAPPPAKRWQRRLSLAFFLAIAVGIYANRGLASDVYAELHFVSGRSMLLLAGLVLLHKCAHASMHCASLPGLRFRRSLVSTESYVGASNACIGGAGIGTGLRVAMFRSWGHSVHSVAASIWATAIVPSFALWTVAFAHTLPLVLSGSADRTQRFVAMGAVVFIAGPGTFWWLALRRPEVMRWLAGGLEQIRSAVLAALPLSGAAAATTTIQNSRVANLRIEQSLDDIRAHAHALGRRRFAVMYGAAISGQLLLPTILLASVHAFEPTTGNVDALTIFRAFAILRVVSSFVPLPGGIGIVDVGFLGVLTAGGVARPTALAAIALYRGITFVLPMLTGPVCAAAWRIAHRRRKRNAAAATALGLRPRPFVDEPLVAGFPDVRVAFAGSIVAGD